VLQQVKVPRVEKGEKKVARQRRKEGLPARRMGERAGDRAGAEQSATAAPDCLAVGG
jgi:hypothetical protein